MNAMSSDEYRSFGESMGARVCEHLDGYAVVGFHATNGQPIIFTSDSGSAKTRLALSALLQTAMISTSVHPNGQ